MHLMRRRLRLLRWRFRRHPFDLRLPAARFHLAHDFRSPLQKKPPPIADDDSTHHSAMNHLRLLPERHVATHLPEDTHTTAFFYDQISIHHPAKMQLAAVTDRHVP